MPSLELLKCLCLLYNCLQLRASLSLNDLLGSNLDSSTGTGVLTRASGTSSNSQCDDTGNLNLLTLLQSSLYTLDGSLDGLLCVNLAQTSAFSNFSN